MTHQTTLLDYFTASERALSVPLAQEERVVHVLAAVWTFMSARVHVVGLRTALRELSIISNLRVLLLRQF